MGFEAVNATNTRSFKAPHNGGSIAGPVFGVGPPGADGSNTVPTDNALAGLTADSTSQFRAALLAFLGTLAYGVGTVTQVAGQSPDGSGHVTLGATDVGALPSAPSGVQMANVLVLGSNGAAIPAGTPVGTVVLEPPVGTGPAVIGFTLGDANGPITITRSTSAGSRLVCFVNLQAATSITDTGGNTWVKLASTASAGALTNKIVECWECIGAAHVTTVTVNTPAAQNAQATLIEIGGGTGAAVTAVGSNTTGTTTPAVTVTVSANALIIGTIAHGTAQTDTVTAPFATLVDQSARSTTMMGSDSYTPTGSGTYGPAWTLSASAAKGVLTYAVNP
jgi:hypothetical protein